MSKQAEAWFRAQLAQLAASNMQKAQPAPVPASWMEMVTANLVREGVNKHKARELAEHFYGLAPAAQHQCKWPTCQSEEYQQALAEQINQELVTGAAQPAPVQPVGCMRCATPKKCATWGCSPNTWPSETPAAQRQWVGLTDEELSDAYVLGGLRLVQEKIKVRNNG